MRRVIDLLGRRGFTVEFAAKDDMSVLQADGLCRVNSISVGNYLQAADRLFVLCHEAGHAISKNHRELHRFFKKDIAKIEPATAREDAITKRAEIAEYASRNPNSSEAEIRAALQKRDINQQREDRADRFAFKLIKLLIRRIQ